MSLLVNRKPVEDETLTAIRSHCEMVEYHHEAISAEDLDAEGKRLLKKLLVEGEPADGITMHGTRWGRTWCAYRTVD